MEHSGLASFFSRRLLHPCVAARVAQSHDFRVACFDIAPLSFQKRARHFGLEQVVDPRAPAAAVGFVQLDELYSRNGFQQLSGLVSYALPVSEMAGVVISRSEEHTSELQSRLHLVCRLLLEKKKKKDIQ